MAAGTETGAAIVSHGDGPTARATPPAARPALAPGTAAGTDGCREPGGSGRRCGSGCGCRFPAAAPWRLLSPAPGKAASPRG